MGCSLAGGERGRGGVPFNRFRLRIMTTYILCNICPAASLCKLFVSLKQS
jgi:hypothetical protein